MTDLPSAPESELGLLSACVLDPERVFAGLALRGVTPDWFYVPAHRILWEQLYARNGNAQVVTDGPLFIQHLRERVTEKGQTLLDAVGGEQFIATLWNYIPGAGHWAKYADNVEDKARRRAMIDTALRLRERAFSEETDWLTALGEAEATLFGLRSGGGLSQTEHVSGIAFGALDRYEARRRNRGRIDGGVLTGFPDIDRTFNGLQPGWLMTVAARPAMGKTSCATAFAEAAAVDASAKSGGKLQNVPAAIYSLEMTKHEIMDRMLLGRANVDFGKARTGFFNAQGDFDALQREVEAMHHSHLYLFDGCEVDIASLRAQIRRDVVKLGLKIAFIDYLQIIEGSTREAKREIRLRIIEICRGLKNLAKELQIPIVVLAQAGRGSEENPGKEPMLKDLQESSAIEQYSDVVAFIHRPVYYKPWKRLSEDEQERWEKDESSAEMDQREGTVPGQTLYEQHALFLIRKNRHGGVGDIPMLFAGERARFLPRNTKLFSNNPNQRQANRTGTEEEHF